jgi:hypothetical protein
MFPITVDALGNPQPPLLRPMTLADFEMAYVRGQADQAIRQSLYQDYQRYLADFRFALGTNYRQWVNGSFTTSKPDPNDIDVVNFIPYAADFDVQTLNPFCRHSGSVEAYRVDGRFIQIYPAGDARADYTKLLINDACAWFGFDEAGAKTVVELLFD